MRFIVFTFAFLFLFGCAKPYEGTKTKMQVRFPTSTGQSALKYYQAASSGPRSSRIATLDDIDCYGIMVQYNDGLGLGKCDDLTGTVVMSGINLVFGAIPDGGVIEFELDSGPNRTISIFGFSSADGTCPDLNNQSNTSGGDQITDATRVGQITTDIAGETMTLNINISMANALLLNDCYDGPFGAKKGPAMWDQAQWDQDKWGI